MTIFVLFQEIILWIRHFMSPLLDIFSHFIPVLKERVRFENLNHLYSGSQSFSLNKLKADLCFEVSSEGEWEQVAPLVRLELEAGKLVEVIYSSPSLESKLSKLLEGYHLQLRCLRLPLLSPDDLFTWVTARTLILCRYDFFPELLALKWRKNMRLILVSATVKNKNLASFFTRFYVKSLYQMFDQIFTATDNDRQKLMKLGLERNKITSYELRNGQIIKRQEAGEVLLKSRNLSSLKDYIDSFSKGKRVILGSCWPSEMEILGNLDLQKTIKQDEFFVALAPHKLNREYLHELTNEIKKHAPQLPVQLIDSETIIFEKGTLYILIIPGILCELYPLFGTAYVGGGFGRSIHSVSEPFWGGCKIVVGPKTHRSTEFDFVHEISREDISVVPQLKDVARELIQDDSEHLKRRLLKRGELIEQFKLQDSLVLARLQHSLEDFC